MKRAYERLLDYVVVYTTSDEKSQTVPSAEREFDLAHKLVAEMKEIGIADAHVDDKCYVYGTLPATQGMEDKPVIGFIAHMDTAPDFCGQGVKPVLHENYDGGDVVLGKSGRTLSVKDFPHHDRWHNFTWRRRQGGHCRNHDGNGVHCGRQDPARQDLYRLYPG